MDKSVWDVQLELFLTLFQRLAKVVLLDSFLNLQPLDVFVLKILSWLDQNVLDATLLIFGMNKKEPVFLVHKHFNMIFTRKNAYVLLRDLINQFH